MTRTTRPASGPISTVGAPAPGPFHYPERMATRRGAVQGVITRGTTAAQRLRRMDRWLAHRYRSLLLQPDALVVDLGYGATGTTVVELAHRLHQVNPELQLIGVEIDPARVAAAQHMSTEKISFQRGGFELTGLPRAPHVIRAFNVLRQYDEAEVADAWELMQAGLHPEGIIIDGTCSENGRRAAWITLDRSGPISLSIAMKFADFETPSDVAERLPKALIHRNVAPERIHAFLQDWDAAWQHQAAHQDFGTRQRWIAACQQLRAQGWPLLDGPTRWRLGELTIDYAAVAPG